MQHLIKKQFLTFNINSTFPAKTIIKIDHFLDKIITFFFSSYFLKPSINISSYSKNKKSPSSSSSMAKVLHSSDPIHIHTTDQEQQQQPSPPSSSSSSSFSSLSVAVNNSFSTVTDYEAEEITVTEREKTEQELPLLAILVTLFRKSLVSCSSGPPMEIGHPTNVCHLAHVTFDRFNGFLGLPLEFVPQVPTTLPSARLVCCYIGLIMFLSFTCCQIYYEAPTHALPLDTTLTPVII